MNVSVSYLSSDVDVGERAASILELVPGRADTEPFVEFAREIEQTLLTLTKAEFCNQGSINNPVHLKVKFLELPLIASSAEIEFLKSQIDAVTGSYADIFIDRERRQVNAVVVWNPRRMLQDRLLLDHWALPVSVPLLPFQETELTRFSAAFEQSLVSNRGNVLAAYNDLDENFPLDMLAITMASWNTRPRDPAKSAYPLIVEWMLMDSAVGYLATTKTSIDQAFLPEIKRKSILSVLDAENEEINNLYKETQWFDHPNPFK